ncbi:ABSCISIC ACID-INSENSITIVE 5-like protein 3 [Actinidia eriantha]|uniref:ABSCISIC ACID-INSENSITIVE 5-like protein 3 n=1 Tax=Actinidia eriantha TaxID=165200 RepID=UPI002583E35E|nr:ABSCISIC ACID-INSENSITIVE 5-like protein 3 [Actinidia eriantha]
MVSQNMGHNPHIPILLSQNLTYNFPLDEVQNQRNGSNSCRPLNTTNFHELVKNMISSDQEGLSTQNPSSSSSSSSSISFGNFNLNETLLNETIDTKNVDEMWKEIVHQDQVNQQQMALGETTVLESVINPQPLMGINPTDVVQKGDWFKFLTVDSNFQVPAMGFEDVGIGQSENQMGFSLPMSMVPVSYLDSQESVWRKDEVRDEMMEKTIARRQKRMIKNRESAARSRARKQAYTRQLEHKVFQFRKINSWLKKKKELNMLTSQHSTSKPRMQLRRTNSALF